MTRNRETHRMIYLGKPKPGKRKLYMGGKSHRGKRRYGHR
jgi:hypothetical protein